MILMTKINEAWLSGLPLATIGETAQRWYRQASTVHLAASESHHVANSRSEGLRRPGLRITAPSSAFAQAAHGDGPPLQVRQHHRRGGSRSRPALREKLEVLIGLVMNSFLGTPNPALAHGRTASPLSGEVHRRWASMRHERKYHGCGYWFPLR